MLIRESSCTAWVEYLRKNGSFSKYPHRPPFKAMLSLVFISGVNNSWQDGFAIAVDTKDAKRSDCENMKIFLVNKVFRIFKGIGLTSSRVLCFPSSK